MDNLKDIINNINSKNKNRKDGFLLYGGIHDRKIRKSVNDNFTLGDVEVNNINIVGSTTKKYKNNIRILIRNIKDIENLNIQPNEFLTIYAEKYVNIMKIIDDEKTAADEAKKKGLNYIINLANDERILIKNPNKITDKYIELDQNIIYNVKEQKKALERPKAEDGKIRCKLRGKLYLEFDWKGQPTEELRRIELINKLMKDGTPKNRIKTEYLVKIKYNEQQSFNLLADIAVLDKDGEIETIAEIKKIQAVSEKHKQASTDDVLKQQLFPSIEAVNTRCGIYYDGLNFITITK